MDEQCLSYEPSFLNDTFELLSDVKQPSFSSLNDSVSSEQSNSPPTKEESFSDSEAVRNMLTSTPHRNNGQRRSVSLIDVSKIDEFSNRPLSHMMSSWETMGSQSSVGKSRDSGYIHSGSLLSVNSVKLLEMKQGSDHVASVLDECNRLKKELEFSEVLINSLQESNNQLRLKCAAASNRIFELRLKCAHQCQCCSNQSSKLDHTISAESAPDECSDSCSDHRSRSSSPENRSNSYLDSPGSTAFSPRYKTGGNLLESVNEEGVLCENGLEPSDIYLSNLSSGESTLEYHNKFHRKCSPPKSFLVQSSKSQLNSKKLFKPEVSSSTDEESRFEKKIEYHTLEDKKKFSEKLGIQETKNRNNFSHQDECNNKHVSQDYNLPLTFKDRFYKEKLSDYSRLFEEKNVDCSSSSSVENLFECTKEAKANLSEENPIFVANEKNGKFLVGSFKVWGDSSIRVTPVNQFSSPSSSSDEMKNVTPSYDKVGLINQMSNSSSYVSDLKKPSDVFISTPPSSRCRRPVSACSFPINVNISQPRRTSLLGHYKYIYNSKTSFQSEPQDHLLSSPKNNDVTISLKSKSDGYQCKISQYSPTSTLTKISKVYDSPLSSLKVSSSERNNASESSSNSNDINVCNNNLSNIRVSVAQSPGKNSYPGLVLEKLNGLKSKINRSLGSFMSSDPNSKIKTDAVHPSSTAVNIEDLESQVSQPETSKNFHVTQPDASSPISSAPLDLSRNKDRNKFTEPQSMEECLAQATDYAEQVSQGLARLPERLERICNIRRTET